MTNLRYLVTGASGFLGSRLCDRLLAEGAEVHATSRSARGPRGPVRWWQSDLAEHALVQSLFDTMRPDVVIHLAGQVTAAPDLQLVLPAFQSLLMSTLNVLVAGTVTGCKRILTVGSMTEPAISELEPTPSSPYAAAKWSASAAARMCHSLYRTPVVVVRPFVTYGPGQHEAKIVPYVINSLLQGKAPSLSSGSWSADLVYVDDVIEGFVAAATRPGIDGADIDLGSGQLTAIRDVVESIVQLTNSPIGPHYGALPDRPHEQIRVANTAHAKAVLDWTATTSLDAGLAETIRWHREQLAGSGQLVLQAT